MLVTKAPGKVILFGEHAVVYGHPAIAASVDLHTYIFVHDSGPADSVTLDFPMVEMSCTWKISEIPFVDSKKIGTELDPAVVASLDPLLRGTANPFARASALAFLYLYVHICDSTVAGKTYSARSTLPVGAGLGSSASFSVALAAALLEMVPTKYPDPSPVRGIINQWAFLGESCIHGNPSGIDNVVASGGGAVRFVKGKSIEPITMPSVDLVLTNTRVSRHTAQLVAGVAQRCQRFPEVMDPLLEAIGTLCDTVYSKIQEIEDPQALAKDLSELACINHGLLVALGVSHPSLEQVRTASLSTNLGETKLTGAGGGGCAITIVDPKNGMRSLEQFKSALPDMEVFKTSIGGRGVSKCQLDGYIPEKMTDLERSIWSYY